jgi:hypothetical protein
MQSKKETAAITMQQPQGQIHATSNKQQTMGKNRWGDSVDCDEQRQSIAGGGNNNRGRETQ